MYIFWVLKSTFISLAYNFRQTENSPVRYGENFSSTRGIQTTLSKQLHPSTLSRNLGRDLIPVKNTCTEITEMKVDYSNCEKLQFQVVGS